MSSFEDMFDAVPIKPCDYCGAADGYTRQGCCKACGEYMGDGVALLVVPSPLGLVDELADAIRSGKLTTKQPKPH